MRGTDGQQFPTGVTDSSHINVFVPDICRDLPFTHVKSSQTHGVDTLRFELGQLYDSNKTSDSCYCMEPGNGTAANSSMCFNEGLFDIATCRYGSHMVVSQPHFYKANDVLLSNETNVPPVNESVDVSYLEIEPWTGIPLDVSIKLQLNFDLRSYPAYKMMNRRQLVPLLWFEQTAQADDKAVNELNSMLFDKIKLLKVAAGVCIGVGVLIVIVIAIRHYTSKSKRYV